MVGVETFKLLRFTFGLGPWFDPSGELRVLRWHWFWNLLDFAWFGWEEVGSNEGKLSPDGRREKKQSGSSKGQTMKLFSLCP
jgi:hypothetical protein